MVAQIAVAGVHNPQTSEALTRHGGLRLPFQTMRTTTRVVVSTSKLPNAKSGLSKMVAAHHRCSPSPSLSRRGTMRAAAAVAAATPASWNRGVGPRIHADPRMWSWSLRQRGSHIIRAGAGAATQAAGNMMDEGDAPDAVQSAVQAGAGNMMDEGDAPDAVQSAVQAGAGGDAVVSNSNDDVDDGDDDDDDDDDDGAVGGSSAAAVSEAPPLSSDAHPWLRFLTGTAIVAAALVVLGSMASPWPAENAGATFTFRIMKRLAAVWVARKIAAKILLEWMQPAVTFSASLVRRFVPAIRVAPQEIATLVATLRRSVKCACAGAVDKFNANPRGIMLIPVVAAFVGWFTNWLAVKMIFYPIAFFGIPVAQMVEGQEYGYNILQPLGLVGWQGIVPAKAAQMAHTMVTMVTTKLIDVQEVFLRLDPRKVARLLSPEVPEMARGIAKELAPGWAVDFGENALPGAPGPLLRNIEGGIHRYLAGFVVMLQEQVHRVIDLKELVVTEMCEDKRTIVELFQRCGREELKFLTNSGLFFGFLLGLVQMAVWLFYDNPWTLTIGGTIVGYLTNWLALKCIFEPVEPVFLFGGRLKIQGLFLQRQLEVSGEFSDHLASKVLTSEKIWDNMLNGAKGVEFEAALQEYTRDFLTREASYQGRGLGSGAEDVALVDAVVTRVKERLEDHVHVLHEYTDDALGLKELMRERMALMTPQEFERVLHPIFEQDELTLIISGAVLGAIAGFIQQVYTAAVEEEGDGEVNMYKGEDGQTIAVR